LTGITYKSADAFRFDSREHDVNYLAHSYVSRPDHDAAVARGLVGHERQRFSTPHPIWWARVKALRRAEGWLDAGGRV